ncbi:ABC transporter permease [Clostridioides difficile]|nr:ABC transporter permease [Clostridioides difficile]
MNNLMRLELRRTNIKSYLIATGIITMCSFCMLYMFAYMSMIGSDGEFFDYIGILSIVSSINMTCFCVLGSVMHSRFIIDEYIGKRAMLLFSYPIERKKMFYSKFLLVTLFTVGGIILSNLLMFVIFFLSESVFPIVNDNLSISIIIKSIFITLMMAIIAGGFSAISMSIGFKRKSVPTAIVVAVILCALVTNILSLSALTMIPTIVITVLSIIVSFISTKSLANKINYLES